MEVEKESNPPNLDDQEFVESLESVIAPVGANEKPQELVVSTADMKGKERMDKLFRAMAETGASDLHCRCPCRR